MPLSTAIIVPRWLHNRLEAEAARLLFEAEGLKPDFSIPPGEPALARPDSISWQVFKNPVSLFIGGVSAVLLELAEPRVRSGVWDHTSFRTDPVKRLKRTGLAAMMTVYGPRGEAEDMIDRVRRLHSRIEGHTPCGQTYRADDPELLTWVHATAAFGFLEAYRNFARPLTQQEVARYYAEGGRSAGLYGAIEVPASEAELLAYFGSMRPVLEASEIIFDFLDIMCRAPILPAPLRPLQRLFVRAGVDVLPAWARELLQLGQDWRLQSWERRLVRTSGAIMERVPIPGSPPVQACRRIGLPGNYLFQR